MEKIVLDEKSIVIGNLSKLSHVSNEKLKEHVLSNYSEQNRASSDSFNYLYNYYKLPYHLHIQWLKEYIQHFYSDKFNNIVLQSVLTTKDNLFFILEKNESLLSHKHIDEHDLIHSPDYTCIYNLSTGKTKSQITFEYNKGRDKQKKWRVELEPGKFIVFTSSLYFHINKNNNEEQNINLCFNYFI